MQAQLLVNSGLRYNTRRTYSSAQQVYLNFCMQYSLIPVPAQEHQLLWFIAYCNLKGLSAGSIHVYLSAIKSLHTLNGVQLAVNTPRVKLALKSIFEAGNPPDSKFPITYPLLANMIHSFPQTYNHKVWTSILTLAFFGALRSSEYVWPPQASGDKGPLMSSVIFSVHNGLAYMTYKVSKSKTQPHGFSVYIGCSGTSVCAVCSMKQYLELRMAKQMVYHWDPLFQFDDSTILYKESLNKFIKSVAAHLGWDPSKFSSHSLRAGCATTAGVAGLRDWEIKQLGGWASNAYTGYIRQSDTHKLQFAQRLTKI